MQRILHLISICPSVCEWCSLSRGILRSMDRTHKKKSHRQKGAARNTQAMLHQIQHPDPRVRTCCLHVMESGRAKSVSPFFFSTSSLFVQLFGVTGHFFYSTFVCFGSPQFPWTRNRTMLPGNIFWKINLQGSALQHLSTALISKTCWQWI